MQENETDSDYGTDSNRSADADDGANLAERPAQDLPDDVLKKFIRETEDINRHPEKEGLSQIPQKTPNTGRNEPSVIVI